MGMSDTGFGGLSGCRTRPRLIPVLSGNRLATTFLLYDRAIAPGSELAVQSAVSTLPSILFLRKNARHAHQNMILTDATGITGLADRKPASWAQGLFHEVSAMVFALYAASDQPPH